MRNMKYIQLFESFESRILTSVLKNVEKGSSKKILSLLKKICDSNSLPISLLSDRYFAYAKYNKAITIGCEEGENIDKKLTHYKFWFNNADKYTSTTIINGTSQQDAKKKTYRYVDVTLDITLPNRELLGKYKVAKKDVVKMIYKGVETTGAIWTTRDGAVYLISSSADFRIGKMPPGNDWSHFGYSYTDLRAARMIDPECKVFFGFEMQNVADAKLYNIPVEFADDRGMMIRNIDNSFNIGKEYAIIFYYKEFVDDIKERIKSGGVIDTKTLRTKRLSDKKGLIGGDYGIKNADYKKINIERYITKITTVTDDTALANIVKIMPKLFGGKYSLFFIIYMLDYQPLSYNESLINDILNCLYKITNLEDKEKNIKRLSTLLYNGYTSSTEFNKDIDNKLKSLRFISWADMALSEFRAQDTNFLNDILELSAIVNDKIKEKLTEITYANLEDVINFTVGLKYKMTRYNTTDSLQQFLYNFNGNYTGWCKKGSHINAYQKALENETQLKKAIKRIKDTI